MTWTPPTLTTERLVLRPVVEADIDALYAGCSNPNVTQFTVFETHRSRDDAVAFYRDVVLKEYAEGVSGPLAIALRESPEVLIGCCGGRRLNAKCNSGVEFGYWIAEPHWGSGYATEAVKALVPYLFEAFKPERVQAHVIAGNAASERVLQKAGLTFEGTHRSAEFRRGRFWDVRVYSILRAELGR